MEAKFKVFEAPDGRYKLAQCVPNGSSPFWTACWGDLWFNSRQEAERALLRVVAGNQWFYTEQGKLIEGEPDNADV